MKNFIIASLSIACAGATALSCCMVPETYAGTIGQAAQEAVLVWADGREELVLRIDYEITGAESMPEQFAWVVTVPNEPDAYAVADQALFEDMFNFAQRYLVEPIRNRSRGIDAPAEPAGGVELGQRVQVGPYDIQPVRGVGAKALEGLNAWLGANGFPAEDPAHMRYFVDEGFTFLCVKVNPPEGEDRVGNGGMLPPLHLSFASERPYYPLRFSSRQGVFDVNLYTLTRGPLDYDGLRSVLGRLHHAPSRLKRNVAIDANKLPKTLRDALEKGKVDHEDPKWIVNQIRGKRVNRDNEIAGWTEDVFLAARPTDSKEAVSSLR